MATQPVVPEIKSELAALAHKHVNVSFALIAVIVAVLALAGLGGYISLRFSEAQIARAEKSEAAYNDASKRLTDLIATDQAQRLADAQQIASLMSGIAKRDAQPLPKQVQAGLQPNASAGAIKIALEAVYAPVPAFGTVEATPDGKIALNTSQGQIVVSDKVSLDRAQADLVDERSIASLQETTIGTLKTDLSGCQANNVEANKVIAQYKKAAVRSKFRRFIEGAEKAGLFIGGFYLGHRL